MNSIDEQLQTALSHYAAGNFDAARQTYVEVLRREPENVEAWHRLGLLMFQAGQSDVALDCVTKAIGFGGPSAERCCHLALVYRALNQLEQAEASLRQALRLNPNDLASLNNLAVVLLERDQLGEAADLFRRVLAVSPNDATARSNLGNVLKTQGLYAEAAAEYRVVLKETPDHVETLNNLAATILAQGQFEDAMHLCNRVLALSPGLNEARTNHALALKHCARQAIVTFRANIEKDGRDVVAWEGLGEALLITGEPIPAEEAFVRALEIEPDRQTARSNLIYCSQFLPGITARRMSEVYSDWDQRHARPLRAERPMFSNDRDPNRRLRLGILSPNLRTHPAAFLTVRGFENLDRSQFETFFYSDLRDVDDTTERIKGTADDWKVVFEMSDPEIVETIRNDRIDLLIVMAGHTRDNRQLVAARKPAPVQIAWTGDPSGQSAIDWLIADRFLIPDEFDEFYAESILRMPHDYVTFDPPPIDLETGPSPCVSNGYVTFGSFNQAVKYHNDLLELWAGILQRVPESRLHLIGKSNLDNEERLLAPFKAAGIETDRITVQDSIPRQELLESYNEVDICLDTYPFSGGVTTLESLWMGVPVITLPGETFAGRTSLSHISNAGLGDLVAHCRAEYADLAVQLSADTTRLSHIRRSLRDDLSKSPVCDGQQFGQDLSAALRSVWRKWTETRSTS